MRLEEIAWLAALIDGEGCVLLRKDSRAGRRPSLRVSIKMGDADLVERAAALMGASPPRLRVDHRSDKNSDMYEASVHGAKAEAVMIAIRPWMGVRRGAKIDELLATEGLSHR